MERKEQRKKQRRRFADAELKQKQIKPQCSRGMPEDIHQVQAEEKVLLSPQPAVEHVGVHLQRRMELQDRRDVPIKEIVPCHLQKVVFSDVKPVVKPLRREVQRGSEQQCRSRHEKNRRHDKMMADEKFQNSGNLHYIYGSGTFSR